MYDQVDVVDQNPVTVLQSLYVRRPYPFLPELVENVVRDRLDVHIRVAGCKQEEVRRRGDPLEIERDDILSLSLEGELRSAL